jgi:hypothetical protein
MRSCLHSLVFWGLSLFVIESVKFVVGVVGTSVVQWFVGQRWYSRQWFLCQSWSWLSIGFKGKALFSWSDILLVHVIICRGFCVMHRVSMLYSYSIYKCV